MYTQKVSVSQTQLTGTEDAADAATFHLKFLGFTSTRHHVPKKVM